MWKSAYVGVYQLLKSITSFSISNQPTHSVYVTVTKYSTRISGVFEGLFSTWNMAGFNSLSLL